MRNNPPAATTAIGTSAGTRYRSDPTLIAWTMVKYIAGNSRNTFADGGTALDVKPARISR
jgi:hypothetical protein